MDEDRGAKTLSSLIKYLQSLCEGNVPFSQSVEFSGNLYITVDSDCQSKANLVLQERLTRNESDVIFVESNSFCSLNGSVVRCTQDHAADIDEEEICIKRYETSILDGQEGCVDASFMKVQLLECKEEVYCFSAEDSDFQKRIAPSESSLSKQTRCSKEYVKELNGQKQDKRVASVLGSNKRKAHKNLNYDCQEDQTRKGNTGSECSFNECDEKTQGNEIGQCPGKNYVCKVCFVEFEIRQLLEAHEASNHKEENPYKCPLCPATFKIRSSVGRHKLVHSGEKPYKCPTCPAAFKERYLLKRHSSVHTGRIPYICDLCGSMFTQKCNMLKHISIVHRGEKPYMCDICGWKAARKPDLAHHHRRHHTGEKPFVCQTCGKAFVGSSALGEHRKVHTGAKPYICEECGLKVASRSSLVVHRKVHSGDKKYCCEICQKRFRQRGNLQKHVHTHIGLKLYKCDDCSAEFSQKGTLKYHMFTHSGVKTFKCDKCDSKFARREELCRHKRTHKGPLVCGVCQAGFPCTGSLNRHRKSYCKKKE